MKAISTPHAPGAIGPYSQAIQAANFLFLSGQIPLDPTSGKLVEGDISVQAKRVLDNLAAILEAGGCTFASVIKPCMRFSQAVHLIC